MNTDLSEKLKTLPNAPGVYFHHDKSGQIIYVGKAAVLKNRVRQYFRSQKDMDVKTRALVAEIADTDWIEVESEIDALFLEAEMVKRYMPKFNILLRDDKSSIYVRIDMKSQWPYVSFSHNPADDGAEYYGPYYNSYAVKKALRYLRRIFPYYDKPVKLDCRPTKPWRSGVQTEKKTLLRQGYVGPSLTKSASVRLEVENDKKPLLHQGSVGPREPDSVRLDLDAHLGLSPVGMTSGEYKANLRKLISYINGGRQTIVIDLQREMLRAADAKDFELAVQIRDKLLNLRQLQQRIMFGDKEFLDISKDVALNDLAELLNLPKIPARIEGYDISHISGTNVVASEVVFSNGVSDRSQYRKYKMTTDRNDDFYNMNEVITRRFSEKNVRAWGLPDLVLIDGGKGQLDAAIAARDKYGLTIPFIGLAKQYEQIVVKNETLFAGPAARSTPKSRNLITNSLDLGVAPTRVTRDDVISRLGGNVETSDNFLLINLPNSTHIIKLLQRIRDESHRFAVSYHSVIKNTRQTASALDEIPGIGPKTRTKLIRKFGSVNGIKKATESEIVAVVGASKAAQIIAGL